MIRSTLLALAALAAAGTAPARAEPPKPVSLNLADEDKDVAALIKAKGWRFQKSFNLEARAQIVDLTIETKDKPFARVKLTGDEWKTLARSKTVQRLDLGQVDTDDDALKSVAEMKALEILVLNSAVLTDAGMKHLAKHPRLWVLFLSTENLTDDGVAALAAAPGLQKLILFDGNVKGTGFAAFAGSKSFERLELFSLNSFGDEGAKALAGLPQLRSIRCAGTKVTAAGIRAIAEKHVPQEFSIDKRLIDDDLLALLVSKGWMYRPAKEQVSWITRLPTDAQSVTAVSLERAAVTDAGFKAVADCVNARLIDLRETRITDATAVAVSKTFPKLRTVWLARTKVTGTGVKAVAALADIEWFDVGGVELDEESLRAIGGMKKLQELDLKGAKFDPAWLKHLAGAPALKKLNVENTAFDDAATKGLVAAVPNLEALSAGGTKLGDAGLKDLSGLTKLRTLYNYSTPATKKGIEEFKKANPKCLVPFQGQD